MVGSGCSDMGDRQRIDITGQGRAGQGRTRLVAVFGRTIFGYDVFVRARVFG